MLVVVAWMSLSVPTAAPNGPAAALAVEVQEGELPGPEPNPSTSFAPSEYEAPWTWWMGVLLTGVAVFAALGAGLGYFLLVKRGEES